jgi:hypothetical protein
VIAIHSQLSFELRFAWQIGIFMMAENKIEELTPRYYYAPFFVPGAFQIFGEEGELLG